MVIAKASVADGLVGMQLRAGQRDGVVLSLALIRPAAFVGARKDVAYQVQKLNLPSEGSSEVRIATAMQ